MSPALRLAPLAGSPDPEATGQTWGELLPAAVAVEAQPASGEEAVPLVLLAPVGEIDGAAALAAELRRARRPPPLALLSWGEPGNGAATQLEFAVLDLGAEGGIEQLAPPLARELTRIVELGRAVRAFVDADLLDGQDSEVTATTPLLELGIVDSISIVALVDFIEGELGLAVPEEAVHPRHLADVLSIQRLIVGLDAARRGGRAG